MKKVSIIVQKKDAQSSITKLRSLGVLHVEHIQPPKGKEISRLHEDLECISSALNILSETEFRGQPISPSSKAEDWCVTVRHLIDLRKRLDQLREYSRRLSAMIEFWQAWGDFDPDEARRLAEKNIFLKLYQLPEKEIKNLPQSVIVRKVSVFKGLANCVIIAHERINISYKEIPLPKMSLKKMRERIAEDKKVIVDLIDEIKEHKAYQENLLLVKKDMASEIEFREALGGMGEDGEIVYLSGYVPIDTQEKIVSTARREKWAILAQDPSDDDRVPTLIRNPRWVSIVRPVFRMLEIIPGYRELDMSFFFLIFFSIFFGMLIGDAGYGAVYFLLTLFAQNKWGSRVKDKSIFMLFYLLSSFAVIWGVLSGTFFGQEWLSGLVKPLIPALRDDRKVQTICFLLGATHLSIAHLWRLIVKLPSLAALSEMGWGLILWAAFFLAKTLILGDNFPAFTKLLFFCGSALVILFSNPKKNILKGIGAGFGNFLMNVVNNFTDIVSYIRLFAVGLATVAVADAFNKMALGIGFSNILSGIFTSLILFIGHGLNILLGPMSVLVHGVRLNVLEFSSHLDVKWAGFAYKPLKGE